MSENKNQESVLCEATQINISLKLFISVILAVVLTVCGWIVTEINDNQTTISNNQKAIFENQKNIAENQKMIIMILKEQETIKQLIYKVLEKE